MRALTYVAFDSRQPGLMHRHTSTIHSSEMQWGRTTRGFFSPRSGVASEPGPRASDQNRFTLPRDAHVKDTCSTNRIMYTPLLSLWESGRGGRVSSTTRSDAARPRRRGQPTYRAGRQSSALEQEDVIAVLGLPSSRPGGPGLGRWPATTMTGTRPSGRWAPRREPRVPRRLQNQLSRGSHSSGRGFSTSDRSRYYRVYCRCRVYCRVYCRVRA